MFNFRTLWFLLAVIVSFGVLGQTSGALTLSDQTIPHNKQDRILNICSGTTHPTLSIAPASGTTGTVTYQWESNDALDFTGTLSNVGSGGFTFNSATQHTSNIYYRVKVTDNSGPFYSDVFSVKIHPAPTITATVSTDTVPPGASVSISALLTNPPAGYSYTYSWGSGLGSSNPLTVTSPSSAGTYSYTVTATDDSTCEGPPATATITVAALYGGQIENSTGASGTIELCSGTAPGQLYGDNVNGTSTLGSGGTGVANEIIYQWQKKTTGSFADIGAATSANLDFTDLVTNGTPVYVRRKATNMGIDAFSNELKFEAPALPSPTATATSRKLAPGGSTTLNVGSFSSYAWTLTSTGAAIPAVSGVPQTSLRNPSTGALTQTTDFTVTVTDALTCTGTDTVLVTVTPLSAGTIGGDTTFCHDEANLPNIRSVTPASGGSGSGYNYLWLSNDFPDFSGTSTSLTTTASYAINSVPTSVTYYRRRAEDPTNLGTYEFSNVAAYTPHTPNAITATVTTDTVPPGASVTLSLSGEAGGTQGYLWNSNAGNATTKDVTVVAASVAGNTIYNVQVTDAQSCAVTSSDVTVTVVALSGGQIENSTGASGTIELCSGTAPGQLYGDNVNGTSTLGSGGTGVANEITYQWQKKTTGSFADIGAATSANLDFTDLVIS